MILVSTGTNGAPFDRLLRELDELGEGEELVVQHGPSALRPRGATCVAAIPFQQFVEEARRARVFVTDTATLRSMLRETARGGERGVRSPIVGDLESYLDSVIRPRGAQPLVATEHAP